MKQLIISLLLTSSLCFPFDVQADTVVKSPDGRMVVAINDTKEKLHYTVTYDGQQMLLPSNLGLKTSIGDFTEHLSLMEALPDHFNRHYSMTGTKQAEVDYEANTLLIRYQNREGHELAIRFQVSNHDVAFRYEMPRQQVMGKDMKRCLVYSETTSFLFPDGTTTFLSPQIGPETGWEQTKPSYEEVYCADKEMNKPSKYGHGYIFPALFHLPCGWALISETGVGSGYAGSHLSDYKPQTGYAIDYPDAGENGGFGSPFAAIPLPGVTPWRTITVGTTLKPIVETTVSYDVVEPLYKPSTTYKPGRYTWSWLIWQDNSINYADQIKFIDLAAVMGFEYCLVDNWWDTQIGRDRIEQLSKYAQSKGVSLMLWYNSNGYWNDAPQGPRGCMNTAISREKEMKWLQSIGAKGIKVDFFGGDKQEMMRLYEDILSDANRHGLQVIFHGCTLPRGWERMYPNFVASEAVLASENVFFNEESARRESYDLTLHPFCRNATASMDWGGIIMNHHLSPDNKSRHQRHTTDIFEMASGIIMQTAIQCVAMQPNNLDELPQFELDFLRTLPTEWNTTQYIDGYPTQYVVLGRQTTAGKWYVAGLNGAGSPRELTLHLPMFAGKTVKYYSDEKSRKGDVRPTLQTIKIDKNGQLKVVMQPSGGLIITE